MWDDVMDMLDAAREERFSKQSVRMRVHVGRYLSSAGSDHGTRMLRFKLDSAVRWCVCMYVWVGWWWWWWWWWWWGLLWGVCLCLFGLSLFMFVFIELI
jgi:hypothetical protein